MVNSAPQIEIVRVRYARTHRDQAPYALGSGTRRVNSFLKWILRHFFLLSALTTCSTIEGADSPMPASFSRVAPLGDLIGPGGAELRPAQTLGVFRGKGFRHRAVRPFDAAARGNPARPLSGGYEHGAGRRRPRSSPRARHARSRRRARCGPPACRCIPDRRAQAPSPIRRRRASCRRRGRRG